MITTPQPTQKIFCHRLHIERAQQGFTMCVDCRRSLFPAPKNKSKPHSVYCSPDCFSVEQIAEFALKRNGSNYHVARDGEESATKISVSDRREGCPFSEGKRIVREQRNFHLIEQVDRAGNIFGESVVQTLITQACFCGRPE